jgi:hypothetical protein
MAGVLLYVENADVGVQIYADDMVLIEQAP